MNMKVLISHRFHVVEVVVLTLIINQCNKVTIYSITMCDTKSRKKNRNNYIGKEVEFDITK